VTRHSTPATGITPETLQIGEWTFHASAYRLEHDQQQIKLEPRVAQLLACLAENAGMPVSRQTLMDRVWPGMVVGDEALTNAINKLRKAFDEDRQNPQFIETIPKAGYRLIAPVRPGPETQPEDIAQTTSGSQHIRLTAVTLIAISLAVFFFVVWQQNRVGDPVQQQVSPGISMVGKPAVAVLPFNNLGEDSQQEYFSDGITDDIITQLAKNPNVVIVARDSSFFYKNKSPDLLAIADELGVGHILRGSIRRNNEKLMINVQLMNTRNGTLVWAEQYSDVIDHLFTVERKIADGVIAALLHRGEISTDLKPVTMPTRHTQAHDYLMLGRYHFYKFASKKENSKAQRLFQEAIDLDPDYALAYAMLGWTFIFEAMNGWTDDRPAVLKRAEELAGKAIAIQPELPLAYYVRGLSYREQGDYVKALVEAETALKYDPNNANNRVLLATLLYYAGRPEVGLERIKEAMQINPHHPYNYHFHLGQAYFVLRQYDAAIDAFQQGLSSNPASERLRVWLAATYAQSGNLESASWEAEQILGSNPDFSVARMEEAFPFKDPDDVRHFVGGLRLAGLK
jgi:TolB-like protein/DNA-binding winged helix-turn-helix (wHTH) protein/cytochrome c-type biogenesis protein CcmH/NrfG